MFARLLPWTNQLCRFEQNPSDNICFSFLFYTIKLSEFLGVPIKRNLFSAITWPHFNVKQGWRASFLSQLLKLVLKPITLRLEYEHSTNRSINAVDDNDDWGNCQREITKYKFCLFWNTQIQHHCSIVILLFKQLQVLINILKSKKMFCRIELLPKQYIDNVHYRTIQYIVGRYEWENSAKTCLY